MKMINKLENPDANFDLYFMAYDGPKSVSHGKNWTDREGLIELTHNYGESDLFSFIARQTRLTPQQAPKRTTTTQSTTATARRTADLATSASASTAFKTPASVSPTLATLSRSVSRTAVCVQLLSPSTPTATGSKSSPRTQSARLKATSRTSTHTV